LPFLFVFETAKINEKQGIPLLTTKTSIYH
jgi:hypothetical protein